MPRIHTHLSLSLKLNQQMNISNLNTFLLGSAYPDIWDESIDKALKLHYKDHADSCCDLTLFLKIHHLDDDFNLGYYFHLWVDNEISSIDISNISKYDCMICDNEVISPILSTLKAHNDKETQTLNNISKLQNEPMPLYLVHNDKKEHYNDILDTLVYRFIKHLKEIGD